MLTEDAMSVQVEGGRLRAAAGIGVGWGCSMQLTVSVQIPEALGGLAGHAIYIGATTKRAPRLSAPPRPCR